MKSNGFQSFFHEVVGFFVNVDAWRANFLYVDSVEVIRRQYRILYAVRLNEDTMAEWLRRVIRNHLGLSRTGSSPVSVEFAFASDIFLLFILF